VLIGLQGSTGRGLFCPMLPLGPFSAAYLTSVLLNPHYISRPWLASMPERLQKGARTVDLGPAVAGGGLTAAVPCMYPGFRVGDLLQWRLGLSISQRLSPASRFHMYSPEIETSSVCCCSTCSPGVEGNASSRLVAGQWYLGIPAGDWAPWRMQ